MPHLRSITSHRLHVRALGHFVPGSYAGRPRARSGAIGPHAGRLWRTAAHRTARSRPAFASPAGSPVRVLTLPGSRTSFATEVCRRRALPRVHRRAAAGSKSPPPAGTCPALEVAQRAAGRDSGLLRALLGVAAESTLRPALTGSQDWITVPVKISAARLWRARAVGKAQASRVWGLGPGWSGSGQRLSLVSGHVQGGLPAMLRLEGWWIGRGTGGAVPGACPRRASSLVPDGLDEFLPAFSAHVPHRLSSDWNERVKPWKGVVSSLQKHNAGGVGSGSAVGMLMLYCAQHTLKCPTNVINCLAFACCFLFLFSQLTAIQIKGSVAHISSPGRPWRKSLDLLRGHQRCLRHLGAAGEASGSLGPGALLPKKKRTQKFPG